MLIKIAIAVVVIVALLLVALMIAAARKPDRLHVRREATIGAPPERIFPLIIDFHRWTEWSPYEKRDPALKRKYSGAPSGKGAMYEWEGNSQIGQGRMEIAEVAEPNRVSIRLDFIKPMTSSNTAEFTLAPQGNSTRIAWDMQGPTSFMMKVSSVLMNLDKMIGSDYEVGLANLKAIAEKN